MAPKKAARRSRSMAKPEESPSDDTSNGIGTSQDVEMKQDVQDITAKCTQRIKKRRRQRKDEILSAHNARLHKLHGDIKQCFKNYEERRRKIRRPCVQRLLDLHREKSDIEDRIDRCHADLEKGSLDTAMQLQVAIDDRVDELSH